MGQKLTSWYSQRNASKHQWPDWSSILPNGRVEKLLVVLVAVAFGAFLAIEGTSLFAGLLAGLAAIIFLVRKPELAMAIQVNGQVERRVIKGGEVSGRHILGT